MSEDMREFTRELFARAADPDELPRQRTATSPREGIHPGPDPNHERDEEMRRFVGALFNNEPNN